MTTDTHLNKNISFIKMHKRFPEAMSLKAINTEFRAPLFNTWLFLGVSELVGASRSINIKFMHK